MAKKQRRDSVQELMVEHMQEAKPRQKRHYTVMTIPVEELKIGDRIVSRVNPHTGKPAGYEEVKKIERDVRGCRNTHVNDNKCYDRAGFVDLSVSWTSEGDYLLPDGSYGTQEELLTALGMN